MEFIPIPEKLQYVIAYSAGIPLSMYFAFYLYIIFGFKKLHFLSTKGPFIFILAPFLLIFIPVYLFFENLLLSIQLLLAVPAIYIVIYLTTLGTSIKRKLKEVSGFEKANFIYKIIVVGSALLLWTTLPLWTLLGPEYERVELAFTNLGFMIMSFDYISSTIAHSKEEYQKLLKSERALKEMNESLTEKVKERTRKLEEVSEKTINTFLNIAHETKTPLTLINNYLEEIDLDDKKSKKDELQLVKNNIVALGKNIDNFFDIEKFKRGFFVYDHDQITDFSKLLKETTDQYKHYDKSKNILFVEDIEPDILIKADPGSLNRLIGNLLENAIKFNLENGQINLTLKSIENEIIFIVKDTGIGIPQDQLNKIFEPYFQINKKKMQSSGMGMGLAIVKNIVQSLKGKILVNSTLEQETEFKFTFSKYVGTNLPVEYENKVKVVPIFYTQIHDEIHDNIRPTLLLIEDNRYLLYYMVLQLKERYNLVVASDGYQALKKMDKVKNLDIIISDVKMDAMGGFEFIKSIRYDTRFAHIPVIFITARTNKEKHTALGLGAIDYINKPFLIKELVAKIESILRILEKQRFALIGQAYKAIPLSTEKLQTDNLNLYKLTNREKEIVLKLKEGASSKIISDSLNISNKTVAKHIQNIFEKLKVSSRIELLNKIYSQR